MIPGYPAFEQPDALCHLFSRILFLQSLTMNIDFLMLGFGIYFLDVFPAAMPGTPLGTELVAASRTNHL